MNALYFSVAVVLLATIILGLAHVFRQPGRADSLLAALLFGTTGVALVLVLGKGLGMARALDIALVFALLAAVLGAAFVLRGWPGDDAQEDAQEDPQP
jgi:multicomponent Na+:H+ antiporter subunit F